MQIFAQNGFNDVSITATNAMTSSIEIRCGQSYSTSCTVEQTSPWHSCTDVDSSCNHISYSPTTDPTAYPTSNPTIHYQTIKYVRLNLQ